MTKKIVPKPVHEGDRDKILPAPPKPLNENVDLPGFGDFTREPPSIRNQEGDWPEPEEIQSNNDG